MQCFTKTRTLSKSLIRRHDWNSVTNRAISNFQAQVFPSLYLIYSKGLGPAPRSCWLTHRQSQQFSVGEMGWDVVTLGSQRLHVPALCFWQPAHSHIGFSCRVKQKLVRMPQISQGFHNLLSHNLLCIKWAEILKRVKCFEHLQWHTHTQKKALQTFEWGDWVMALLGLKEHGLRWKSCWNRIARETSSC